MVNAAANLVELLGSTRLPRESRNTKPAGQRFLEPAYTVPKIIDLRHELFGQLLLEYRSLTCLKATLHLSNLLHHAAEFRYVSKSPNGPLGKAIHVLIQLTKIEFCCGNTGNQSYGACHRELAIEIKGPSARRRERAVEIRGLFSRLERLLPAPELGQPVGESVERSREIWRERLGARRRERAIKIGRLFSRLERLLPAPELGQPVGESVERSREIWRERLGPRRRERAIKIGRLFSRLERLLPAPSPDSPLARLLSDAARSGVNASGRAAASAR